MSIKKIEKRPHQQEEDREQVKVYKKLKKHQESVELDDEDMDDDLLFYCQKYLK